MKLVGRHALLAGGNQVNGEHPLVQRDFATLSDRPDRYRELLATRVALEGTRTMRLPLHPGDVRGLAAMRTEWAVGPHPCLKPLARLRLVLEDWAIEIGRHCLG